jgi:hypothetical protein
MTRPDAVLPLLRRVLERSVTSEGAAWLESELDRQRERIDERRLAIALAQAGRRVGRHALALNGDEAAAADRMRSGWQPQFWHADDAARVVLVLATWRGDGEAFAATVNALCATAEIGEHVSYLRGFAVFPAGGPLCGRAREGVRSSAAPVFEAIACRNPYPRDWFDQATFNQMVVKCVFVGAPIGTIVGLRERRNGELVRMLSDFIAERRAAGRSLPEEVHRFVEAKA